MTTDEVFDRGFQVAEHTKATFRSYLFYRVLLATLLFGLYLGGSGPSMLGSYAPHLFATVAPVYLAMALISISVDFTRRLNRATQCYFAIFVDIVAIVYSKVKPMVPPQA